MDDRRLVLKETVTMALGQALCVALMLGVFALLGRLDDTVLLGGLLGWLFAVLNHLFLAMGAMLAARKALGENVKGGKNLIQFSFFLRLAVLFLVMFALLKSGRCNVFSLVLPLLFTRPILTVEQFFRKDGEGKS